MQNSKDQLPKSETRVTAFKVILIIVILGSSLFTSNGYLLYLRNGQTPVLISVSIGFLFLLSSICSLWLINRRKFELAVTIFIIAAAVRGIHLLIVTPDSTFPLAVMYCTVFIVTGIFLSDPKRGFAWLGLGLVISAICILIRVYGPFTMSEIKDPFTHKFALYVLPIACLTIISTICVFIVRQFQKSLLESIAARHSLEQSNKLLESFAYVASHDLQAPLRSITTLAQLIERDHFEAADSETREYIQTIIKSAKQMRGMIQSLLHYSQLKTQQMSFQSVHLNDVMSQVLTNLKPAIEENSAVIKTADLPTIEAYPSLMIQLFQNLINNAITFKSEQIPQIEISATLQDKNYLFAVKDNGIGIQAENYDKVFQIFQRLHGQEKGSGHGIGLAIVHEILRTHRGKIWIESESGKGSTFFFTLPISQT